MSKTARISDEYQGILRALKGEADGLSTDAIEAKIKNAPDRRTLQRRIKELVSRGQLRSMGRGRGVKYILSDDSVRFVNRPNNNALIPLSDEGKIALEHIAKPLANRTPSAYERAFLESYQPNVSSYLTSAEKKKLFDLGITAQMDAAAGTYAKQILQRLLIDLAWNSSRLEGNTYSLLDTKRLLDQGVLASEKSAADAQMILNHKDAIEFIVHSSPEIGFNRYTILNLHGLLSNNLLPNPAASGALRTHPVGIAGSVYSPPNTPQLIIELFDLLLDKTSKIEDPFEQAFFIMVHLPYLQPFDDVNKRVSRLAANIPLNQKNLAPLSFVEVPDTLYIKGLLAVYELNKVDLLKDVFLWAYERSAKQYASQRQSLGEPDPFMLQYRDTIRSLVAEIISTPHGKEAALKLIRIWSRAIPKDHQAKFEYAVENELIHLHEGNFARYFVSPSQFQAWQKVWNAS